MYVDWLAGWPMAWSGFIGYDLTSPALLPVRMRSNGPLMTGITVLTSEYASSVRMVRPSSPSRSTCTLDPDRWRVQAVYHLDYSVHRAVIPDILQVVLDVVGMRRRDRGCHDKREKEFFHGYRCTLFGNAAFAQLRGGGLPSTGLPRPYNGTALHACRPNQTRLTRP